jgi:hypothetical protein
VFNGSLDEGVLVALQQMLEQHNPLVQQLQMAIEFDDGTEQATIVIDSRGACCRGRPALLPCCLAMTCCPAMTCPAALP